MAMSTTEQGARRRARLAAARLYLVCPAAPELDQLLGGAIAGGVDVVQLRDKDAADARLLGAARAARELCQRLGALLIVNDRPDLALRAGADGVHVGQDDMPVGAVRELVGPDVLVGLSTHAPAEIDRAGAWPADERAGVDYIGVGPVHETPTKPGRAAVGLALVRYAAAHASVPFFAIGGIDATNVGAVLGAGARSVCVLRAITEAQDARRAARALRAALDAAVGA
jgi:thiamine-phosphate pyrophosphorylase